MSEHILLGTESPRRRQFFKNLSVPFTTASSSFPEETIPFHGDPKAYVETLAMHKGKQLQQQFPQHLILTFDTTVYFQGHILNKPKNREQAFEFISKLSGHTHQVFSAISLRSQDREQTASDQTLVSLRPLTPQQIHAYHQRINPLDKAGAYSLEGPGVLICSSIQGCFLNVLGIPLNPLVNLCQIFGINLWSTP